MFGITGTGKDSDNVDESDFIRGSAPFRHHGDVEPYSAWGVASMNAGKDDGVPSEDGRMGHANERGVRILEHATLGVHVHEGRTDVHIGRNGAQACEEEVMHHSAVRTRSTTTTVSAEAQKGSKCI